MNKYYYFKSLYKGELLKRIQYLIRKKRGYYKKKKYPVFNGTLVSLNLIDKDLLKGLNPNLFIKKDLIYDVLNNPIKVDELDFKDNNKNIWIYEDITRFHDVKNEWELNRLQFLLPLASLAYINNDSIYSNLVLDTINKWQISNNYNKGVNWNSNLEVAIRSISIYLCFELLNGKADYDFSKILYEHGTHLYDEVNYSKSCIPNNHVFGEATALVLLGRALNINKWVNRGINLINKFNYLLSDEGVSIEGSFSYQFFLTQMFVLLSTLNVLSFNQEKKITSSLTFLKTVTKPNGELVNFGDNDEGYYFNFFWNKEKNLSIKYLNLVNNKIDFNSIEKLIEFNIDDYKVLNNEKIFLLFNSQKEINHSHSDNLSIELSLDGKDILTDSGTESYNKSKETRRYFRSSLAHNTISFNNKDHNMQIGSFRWYKFSKASFNEGLSGTLIDKDKNQLKRTLSLEPTFKIIDEIKSKSCYVLRFHFAEALEVEKVNDYTYKLDNEYLFRISGSNLELTLKFSFISNKYNDVNCRYCLEISSQSNNKIETEITKIN